MLKCCNLRCPWEIASAQAILGQLAMDTLKCILRLLSLSLTLFSEWLE